MRLRHLFTGDLSWRELDVYLRHLPLESATQTLRLAAMDDVDFDELAASEHKHGPWSHTDLLLASVVDGIERLTHVQLRRGGVKGGEPPKPIPRPGVRASNVHAINPAAQEYLERLRRQHEEGA